MTTYEVNRLYADSSIPRETLLTGLSLEQAKAHCKDPETSASTCVRPENVVRTAEYGFWFEGFTRE